jgi:hypothetical protein
MSKTPENATEYLKTLLGKRFFLCKYSKIVFFLIDFAAKTIPPDKHRDTPCKFYSYSFDYSVFLLVYILATAGLRFLSATYEL